MTDLSKLTAHFYFNHVIAVYLTVLFALKVPCILLSFGFVYQVLYAETMLGKFGLYCIKFSFQIITKN